MPARSDSVSGEDSLSFFFFSLFLKTCGILVPRSGIEPRPPAERAPSPNHWMFQNSHCLIFVNNSETATFLLRTHKAEDVRGLSGPSFVRALIPFIRAPPSPPNHLPKAPLLDSSTLEITLQHMRFGGMHSAYSTPGVYSSH